MSSTYDLLLCQDIYRSKKIHIFAYYYTLGVVTYLIKKIFFILKLIVEKYFKYSLLRGLFFSFAYKLTEDATN